jgi:hypothetical protein
MNNIESIFKEKSKKLQVLPSDEAWKRLESRLSPNPTKRLLHRQWLMAACIIGLVLLGSLFFYNTKFANTTFNYETVSLDFSNLDYGDAASKINALHAAYVRLGSN